MDDPLHYLSPTSGNLPSGALLALFAPPPSEKSCQNRKNIYELGHMQANFYCTLYMNYSDSITDDQA